MEEEKEFSNDIITALSYDSPNGSIIVTELEKEITSGAKKSNKHEITFITRDNQTIDFSRRRSLTFVLRNLLENFGEFTDLNRLHSTDEFYTDRSVIRMLKVLRKLLVNTEYIVERNPELHNFTCRIMYKNTDEL